MNYLKKYLKYKKKYLSIKKKQLGSGKINFTSIVYDLLNKTDIYNIHEIIINYFYNISALYTLDFMENKELIVEAYEDENGTEKQIEDKSAETSI